MTPAKIEVLPLPPSEADKAALARLLRACVEGGASIGFVLPLGDDEIAQYWNKIFADLSGGFRVLLVARNEAGRIIGSAQLACESRRNGRHRAEIQKVMVLPECRRGGIAATLMSELEGIARARGVTLIFLDTSEGHGGARAFYERIGYQYVGGIPNYALDPDGTPAKNAIYYRTLG